MNEKTVTELDEYTLFRLLCELEGGPSHSQRDMARRLDSALGLVNNYLKTAGVRGWVRVKELPGNRCSYHLTPKGAEKLRRLALKQARYLNSIIPVVREEYRQICARLKAEGVERVALCGVEGLTDIVRLVLHDAGIEDRKSVV